MAENDASGRMPHLQLMANEIAELKFQCINQNDGAHFILFFYYL